MEGSRTYRNLSTVLLSGGVGGARMARALAAVLAPDKLTVIVNVGDDDIVHGVHVAADLDTVVYTLAGIEGPMGWGRRDDTWTVMAEMTNLGADTRFRLGDHDLATCLHRTARLAAGDPLSTITRDLCERLGVAPLVLPATDDPVRTRVQTEDGTWLDFQDYFVRRQHEDHVAALDYAGAPDANPAPGVIEALAAADVVVIAPSNPPLSVWPILATPGIRDAIVAAPLVVAISPLFSGRALKGPADRVMASLGLAPGNRGVAQAYEGLLTHLVVDIEDAADTATLTGPGLDVVAMATRVIDQAGAAQFGMEFTRWIDEATDGGPVR